MANLIFNVGDIFDEHLHIPKYQRGYKWSSQQVNQLLDDIAEFETNGNNELFYCLQNITLVKSVDGRAYNVVDGQQRLTTISLLLAYLGESQHIGNKLSYAVREPSNQFLQAVLAADSEMLDEILASADYDSFISADYDYQDIYFMYQAIKSMDSWCKRIFVEEKDRLHFKKKLLNNVKVIINKITGVDEQELFMNLNASRVHLDGADLIRAIIITRVAKQEMEEMDIVAIKNVVRLNERRVRIGWELDELNHWWSKQEVADYFATFISIKTGNKETIKFDEARHPINLLYKLWVETEGKNDIRLQYFEGKENFGPLALYASLKQLSRTLKDWYEDREIYHYLGFIFTYNTCRFREIWDKWNEQGMTRERFKQQLIVWMQKTAFGPEPKDDANEETGMAYYMSKITDFDTTAPTNWYQIGPPLEKILICLDVIAHTKVKGIGLQHLKARYFKSYREDKEHIFPGTPKEIKVIAKLLDAATAFSAYIAKLNEGYDGDNIISWSFPEQTWYTMDVTAQEEVLEALRNEIHAKRPINSIGNLVLLHLSINRGFGNDYYVDKRLSVIRNTENGEYVRYHTLKVFVKQTADTEDLNKWEMEDIRQNAREIANTLQSFFKGN